MSRAKVHPKDLNDDRYQGAVPAPEPIGIPHPPVPSPVMSPSLRKKGEEPNPPTTFRSTHQPPSPSASLQKSPSAVQQSQRQYSEALANILSNSPITKHETQNLASGSFDFRTPLRPGLAALLYAGAIIMMGGLEFFRQGDLPEELWIIFVVFFIASSLPLGFVLVGLHGQCILECPPLLVSLVNILPFASGVLCSFSWGIENMVAYDMLKVVTLHFLSALLFRSSRSVKLVCSAASSLVLATLLLLQLFLEDRPHRLRWQEGIVLYSVLMLIFPFVTSHEDKMHSGLSGALSIRKQDVSCWKTKGLVDLLGTTSAANEAEPISQVVLKQKLLRQLKELSDKAGKVYEMSPDERQRVALVMSFLHTSFAKAFASEMTTVDVRSAPAMVQDWVAQNFARSISVESSLHDTPRNEASSVDVKKAQRKYVQGKFQSSGSSRSMQVEPIPEHAGLKQPEGVFDGDEDDFTYGNTVNAMMYALSQGHGQGTPALVSEETAEVLMAQFGNWDFNVVGLSEVLGSQTLRVMATKALMPYAERLDVQLQVGLPTSDGASLESVLQSIESRYNRSNPYHNSVHAADVVNSTAYFFTHFNKSGDQFTDREIFASLLAAAAHDVGHDGKTGRYHTSTESPLALLYNDNSVLEMMHCSIFFAVLRSQGTNLLMDWDSSERQGFRQQVIRMILDTDLAKHFDQVKKFREKYLETEDTERTPEQRQDILSFMLKLSDIGGSAKPFALHAQWATRIQSEFFLQGDLEREVGLPCSPFCDRQVQKVAESQQGFYTYIVKPLYDCLVPFLRSARLNLEVMQNIIENEEFWGRYENERFNYHDPISSSNDLVKQFMYRPNRAGSDPVHQENDQAPLANGPATQSQGLPRLNDS